jgi:hypothetical protein
MLIKKYLAPKLFDLYSWMMTDIMPLRRENTMLSLIYQSRLVSEITLVEAFPLYFTNTVSEILVMDFSLPMFNCFSYFKSS